MVSSAMRPLLGRPIRRVVRGAGLGSFETVGGDGEGRKAGSGPEPRLCKFARVVGPCSESRTLAG